ncbi:MAG: non-ribosomal peptide synthetase [Pseudomonadota bacterium]
MSDQASTAQTNSAQPAPAVDERSYWLARLADAPDKVGFTPDSPAGDLPPDPADPAAFNLDGETRASLLKLAGGSPTKVFMVLAALVAALLHRYSGRRDLVIAAPIFRQAAEGQFINTVLPLRSLIGPATSFKQVLLDLRQTILAAADHQNYALNKLYRDLDLPPVAEGSPLMDVALYLDDIHDPAYLEPVAARICFGFNLGAEAVAVRVEYDPRFFRPATARRIAGHLARLAGLALADLDRPLAALDLISAEEQRGFFFNFPPPAPLPEPATLHGQFALQAAATPDAVALRLDDAVLTYAGLDARANRLAHHLLAQGLRPEEVVGIATHTGFDLIAGLLAVLKAGGAYLPLDPGLPAARLADIAADAGLRRVLSPRPWPEAAALGVTVTDPAPILTNPDLPDSAPACAAGPGSLAYVIYTSGSTGRPKGVLLEHRGVVNFALWRMTALGFGPADVTLQLVPESFDGFGSNLYPTLFSGACLVLINENRWGEVAHIRRELARHQATNCAVVPSMFRLLLEGAEPAELASLTRVTLAGERAPAGLLDQAAALLPNLRLYNEYGPTEDSVAASANPGLSAANLSVIGRPIANHFALVLDGDLALKPIGEPGELCLGGIGLARGYLNRPDETNARFVANPYAALCHGANRLYRSGDLARWLPDGNLELMGRLDQQVQVRGFRVEPQEIEARLLAHPTVRQAAVALRTDEDGQAALWAYLAAEGALEVEDLRTHLMATLPEYMLPAVFMRAPALLLGRHGKLDRAALAGLEGERLGAGAYAAPRNPGEETLARIWAEKLGLAQVGIHDSYFSLGGDSVKAISLLAAINRELGCELKIPDLYSHKTVAELARRVGQSAGAHADAAPAQTVASELDALRTRIMGS